MLDVTALSTLSTKPRIDQISLELLRQYYERNLEPNIFIFELDNGIIVNLDFNKEHLCHLLGIEKMARGAVKYKERYNYFGIAGYNNIRNGIITIQHLKDLNKGRFNFIKDKLIFFYLLPYIVDSPRNIIGFRYER
ncbi:PBECR4 domain-containing protein [Paenibacillus lactis]|uniref:PBECR4 domain-containing protein n=1 Tax=Paenibacillus lactis TaxID=228574 RepID=UPI00119F8B06